MIPLLFFVQRSPNIGLDAAYSIRAPPIAAMKYRTSEDPKFDRMCSEVSPFVHSISPLAWENSPLYEVAEDPEFERIYNEALANFPFLRPETKEHKVSGQREHVERFSETIRNREASSSSLEDSGNFDAN